MKIGRNAPCPCGSGLKYKKCCLGKAETPEEVVGEDDSPSRDEPAGGEETTTRAGPAGGEETTARDGPAGGEATTARDRWTTSKISSMTTEDIEVRLGQLGIPYAREPFMELAEDRVSAATIGELWVEQAELSRHHDRDFAPLAACELWRRLLRHRPSNEMIDGWMQEGYDHQESGDSTEAARIWWKVWETLRARFHREVRTMDAADRRFSGTQSILNWCQDFEMCMSHALDANPELAAMGKQYCIEWIEQFPDEGGHEQVDLRRPLSRYQFHLGETSAGEATLQEINQRWPEEVWGYVALADAYGHLWPAEPAPELDMERALEYVEQGLAMATESFARDALLERREELLRRAAG